MEKIKILFTIPNFLTAGSGREMFNIIERLDKKVFEPYIAVSQPGGSVYEEINEKKYPVIITPFSIDEDKGLVKKVFAAWQLSKKFKPYRFDIWQSFNWSSDFTEALVANFSGARYVYVKKNMNWDRLAWKVKSRLAKAIIARNTTLMKGPFASKQLRSKVFMVPGGVSTDRADLTRGNTRLLLDIPENAMVISCVAQLVKVKDQATLIKAITKIDGAYLILAGAERDPVYVATLRQLIADKGLKDRILLTGSINDVQALLLASDIFVLPTTNRYGHEEGCPVALMEAMVLGIPCIASDVAGNRDLIIPGETGLLFTPENSDALAMCIKKYIDDVATAKIFAANGQRLIENKHTLKKEAAAFEEVYKKLLAEA